MRSALMVPEGLLLSNAARTSMLRRCVLLQLMPLVVSLDLGQLNGKKVAMV
jgi:hypothetical protein